VASESIKREGSPFPDGMKSQVTGGGHYPGTSTSETSKKRKVVSDEDQTDQHPAKRASRQLQWNEHADNDAPNLSENIKSKGAKEEPIADDPPTFWGKITCKFMKR
jgi:hypothetical protein